MKVFFSILIAILFTKTGFAACLNFDYVDTPTCVQRDTYGTCINMTYSKKFICTQYDDYRNSSRGLASRGRVLMPGDYGTREYTRVWNRIISMANAEGGVSSDFCYAVEVGLGSAASHEIPAFQDFLSRYCR